MNISIVIPNHNRANALKLTLDSLAQQSYPPDLFEVIVVDQASTDGSRELVRNYATRFPLRLVEQDAKYGISVARNGGVEVAQSKIFLILDADLLADPGLVEAHVDMHKEYPEALVCGNVLPYQQAYISYIDQAANPEIGLYRGKIEKALPFYEAFGGHMSLSTITLKRIGPWDPKMIKGEDIDFAYRAEQLGIPIRYCPKAISYHNHVRTLQDRLDYAATFSWWPILYQRYPSMRGKVPMISQYEPINIKNDSAKLIKRKIIVRFYGLKFIRWIFKEFLGFFDHHRIFPRLVKAIYWRLFIGTGYAGFRSGMSHLHN